MSYYNDYEEAMYDYWDANFDSRPNIDYDFWTMKDGTQIQVSDMSKGHLINTINLLKQSDNPYADGYIQVMRNELESRSPVTDAINDFADQEASVEDEEYWNYLSQAAKQTHDERVAKNPDRVQFAEEQFKKNNIEYKIKNTANGHIHAWDRNGKLQQFWAGTGKIMGSNLRGIHNFINILTKGE